MLNSSGHLSGFIHPISMTTGGEETGGKVQANGICSRQSSGRIL